MKPQLGLFKEIDSLRSFRQFPMKNYKHLSKLMIVKPQKQIDQDKKVLMSLKNKASLKNLKHLDLSKCRLQDYSLSEVKLIAKKFHRIIGLSWLETKKWPNDFLLSKTMFKEAKSLRYLYLKTESKHCPERFLRLIRLSKLKIFNLISMKFPIYNSTSQLSFPSTIEELLLFQEKEIKTGLKLSHLHNLQKLAFGMPLHANIFQKIIESIADPLKLKSLQFHIAGHHPDIEKFLSHCLNLEELNVKVEKDIYPESNLTMKLRKLSIDQVVCSVEELLRLGDFIQQQKDSLENLDLALDLYGSGMKFWPVKFLEELKTMKKLKKLKLKFDISGIDVQLSLARLVETLEDLEEIDFTELPVEFDRRGFESFCEALGRRNLKSLKLSFNSWTMTPKDSNLLVQTLTLLSGLEYLTLKDFGIEDANFFNELREMICCKNKRLNEVILEGVKYERTKECCENLIEMLRRIIRKPTMKIFCFLESSGCGSDFFAIQVLSLTRDVWKQVYHFDYLEIPPETCRPTFDFWGIDSQKWEAWILDLL